MIRRVLQVTNKRSNLFMAPQTRYTHHGMKKEDFDGLPDKNLETDTDRWSDPNNPTPEQERKMSTESRVNRYNAGTPESNIDLNAEWKGFAKPEEDDLKGGAQVRD